jgi:hypothetical protein
MREPQCGNHLSNNWFRKESLVMPMVKVWYETEYLLNLKVYCHKGKKPNNFAVKTWYILPQPMITGSYLDGMIKSLCSWQIYISMDLRNSTWFNWFINRHCHSWFFIIKLSQLWPVVSSWDWPLSTSLLSSKRSSERWWIHHLFCLYTVWAWSFGFCLTGLSLEFIH